MKGLLIPAAKTDERLTAAAAQKLPDLCHVRAAESASQQLEILYVLLRADSSQKVDSHTKTAPAASAAPT